MSRCTTVSISIAIGLIILSAILSAAAEPKKGAISEIGLPPIPGAKVMREINWPAGKLLDEIAKEFGPLFGLKELNQISILLYQLDPSHDPEHVLKFYEPTITKEEWKTMDKRLGAQDASAIFFHEKRGMLIISVGPKSAKGRELTIARLFGSMDPTKIGDTSGKLPEFFEKMLPRDEPAIEVINQARIPVGQPISVPPSEKLHIKSNRSDLIAVMTEGNTAEIRVADRVDDPGELTRIDERLVLNLSSKLPVERLSVPAGIPVLFEPTEGSLEVTVARNAKPARLSIVSIGAPIKIRDFPLVGGVHMIKSTGGEINVILAQVTGGEMVIAATGDDVSLEIPRNASAEITAQATKGTVTNLTGSIPSIEEKDKLKLTVGDGRAKIALEAVNGTVCIRTSD